MEKDIEYRKPLIQALSDYKLETKVSKERIPRKAKKLDLNSLIENTPKVIPKLPMQIQVSDFFVEELVFDDSDKLWNEKIHNIEIKENGIIDFKTLSKISWMDEKTKEIIHFDENNSIKQKNYEIYC